MLVRPEGERVEAPEVVLVVGVELDVEDVGELAREPDVEDGAEDHLAADGQRRDRAGHDAPDALGLGGETVAAVETVAAQRAPDRRLDRRPTGLPGSPARAASLAARLPARLPRRASATLRFGSERRSSCTSRAAAPRRPSSAPPRSQGG